MTYRSMMIAAAAAIISVGAATAGDYGPGVSDTEIKLGQTIPYSGPASAYGTIGRIEEAYFNMVNSKGGVNGRKIRMISLDDAYSPPKTVEQTRKLVEQEEVLAIVGTIGTPTNSATQRYLNAKKVPQIFISTGAAKWDDPKNFPYTTALYPPYQMEGQIFAKYLLKNKPDAKLGVFSQNDDAGKDYVRGLKEGLGDKAAQIIVKEVTYEVSDPTIDSQIVALKASGADTLFTMATPKFGAQAIRKVAELGWSPLNYVVSVSSSITGVLEPAGLTASKGLLTALAFKTATDPRWNDAKDVQEFRAVSERVVPERRCRRRKQRRRLCRSLHDGEGSSDVRRRSDAGESDASGHQSDQSGGASAAARHHDHHHAAALLALYPNADRALRWHQLGTGRSGDFSRLNRPVNRN